MSEHTGKAKAVGPTTINAEIVVNEKEEFDAERVARSLQSAVGRALSHEPQGAEIRIGDNTYTWPPEDRPRRVGDTLHYRMPTVGRVPEAETRRALVEAHAREIFTRQLFNAEAIDVIQRRNGYLLGSNALTQELARASLRLARLFEETAEAERAGEK